MRLFGIVKDKCLVRALEQELDAQRLVKGVGGANTSSYDFIPKPICISNGHAFDMARRLRLFGLRSMTYEDINGTYYCIYIIVHSLCGREEGQ
jgi:hypothetical protein